MNHPKDHSLFGLGLPGYTYIPSKMFQELSGLLKWAKVSPHYKVHKAHLLITEYHPAKFLGPGTFQM